MASRTTETAVREIIQTNLTGPQVRAFISDASLWITEELGAEDPPLSLGRLEVIERYLACALVRLRDMGLKDSTIQDVSETYQVDSEMTDYLMRAASFDPTGKVRAHFMAAKPIALASAPSTPVKFRVGDGFVDVSVDE